MEATGLWKGRVTQGSKVGVRFKENNSYFVLFCFFCFLFT